MLFCLPPEYSFHCIFIESFEVTLLSQNSIFIVFYAEISQSFKDFKNIEQFYAPSKGRPHFRYWSKNGSCNLFIENVLIFVHKTWFFFKDIIFQKRISATKISWSRKISCVLFWNFSKIPSLVEKALVFN